MCDGQNGTPDLRNRFIVGAGSTYAVGAKGGSTTHTHVFSGVGIGEGNVQVESKANIKNLNMANGNNLPPYYALCYIMKL